MSDEPQQEGDARGSEGPGPGWQGAERRSRASQAVRRAARVPGVGRALGMVTSHGSAHAGRATRSISPPPLAAAPQTAELPEVESEAPRAAIPGDPAVSVFRNRDFLLLWSAQGTSLVVNTALQFVWLILIVEKTGSSIAGSGLIIFLAAPPVLFGPISGVIVDRIDKRTVLITTNVVRAGATALLLLADGSVALIYAVAFVTATMGQFNLPAASAAVPAFVPRAQFLTANSVFQLTTAVGQLMGMVVVAPVMLKALGFDWSYIVGAILLLVTAPLLARLPSLPPEAAEIGDSWRARLRAVPQDLRDTWVVVRRDRLTQLAMLQLSTGGMLLFMFALLVPRFVTDVLERPAEDSVFVFWPVGVGALLALRALPALGRRYSPTGIVTVALFGLTLSIGAFAAINFLVDALQDTHLGLDSLEGDVLFIGVTMVLAFPMGITYAMVNAPAQTVLHERAPAAVRGRIFASQLMVANAASMVALLVIGGVADATSVEAGLFGVAVITLLAGLASVYMRRLAAVGGAGGLDEAAAAGEAPGPAPPD